MQFQNIIMFGLFVAVCSWPAHAVLSLEKREVTEPSCPDGWTLFGEKCYFYSGSEKTDWDRAQIACFKVEGQLVEIGSYTENAFLVELKSNFSSNSSESWIGLSDRDNEGEYIWVSTGIGVSHPNYQSWAVNEPEDNDWGSCVQMHSDSYWYDTDCTLKRSYFCERLLKAKCPSGWTFFTGHCYKYSREVRKVWEEAEAACVADKGHLVDINSVAEKKFLAKLMNADFEYLSDVWIGLNDIEVNGTYVWVSSGEKATYTPFAGIEDDWTQACILMTRYGWWVDRNCSYSRPYLCKKASCPYGWTLFGESCYLYSGSEEKTWDAAQSACYKAEGQLVEIQSASENNFIVELKTNFSSNPPLAWIGLQDIETEGMHIWVSTGNSTTYTNWVSGEPNNYNNEDCGGMRGNGKWNDKECHFERTYVCERLVHGMCPKGWIFFRGKCYKHDREDKKDWEQAEAACVADYSHLVDINSEAENKFLTNLMRAGENTWTGLKLVGDAYKWMSSGNNATFTSWAPGQPSSPSSEHCVEMWPDLGKWNDNNCTNRRQFFCEKLSSVQ